jgi:monovalent cation:proton antiporter-2 (CPA2) family protein
MQTGFFFQAFVYLCASVIAVPIARRLGLGSVLGYLIAGIAIGPFALGLVGREGQDVLHFAEFGVVMMLFLIGLELEPAKLWSLRGALLGMGGLQVVATSALLALAALVFQPWRSAVVIGFVLSLSSTAIVLQSMRERGMLRSDAGERSFAVLLFQDLAVIPMLVLLPLLARAAPAAVDAHAAPTLLAGQPGWVRALATLAAVAVIVLAGRFLVRPILRFIAKSDVREVFTAGALLLVVAIVLLMQAVGLSPALGTFLGGVVLANSEYRHELESDIEPAKGLLLGLFFLSVGASIDFGVVAAHATEVALLVAGLVVAKALVLFAIGRGRGDERRAEPALRARARAGRRVRVRALLVGGTGRRRRPADRRPARRGGRALDGGHAAPARAARAGAAAASRRSGSAPTGARAIDERGAVILAGFGAFGSIVGRFLIANRVPTTVLDADSDHVALLRRVGIRGFYGDASREDLLRAAGAAEARVLLVSTSPLETTLAIIRTAKRHFPNLRVYARALTRVDAYEIYDAGADRVYRSVVDTSLRSGVDVLRELGFPAHPATRAAQRFRRQDEADWRRLAAIRHDTTAWEGQARESNRHLERLLGNSLRESPAATDDAAWDSASLRAEFGKPEEC